MRTITTAQAAVLVSGVQAEFARLSVKDAGGTFRDLSTFPGFNAVRSVSWREAIGDPGATFSATLMRELYDLNLSPYMENSAPNRGFDPSADFSPLLALFREVKIEVAIVPMDTQPASGDWFEVFRGRIDHVDVAAGPNITIDGRDLSGRLASPHGFIKRERVYAFAADGATAVGLRVWDPEMSIDAGEYVLPASRAEGSSSTPPGTDDPGLNKFLKCDTTGIAGTTEPVWTTAANQNDGTARYDYIGAPSTGGFPVEDIIQNILDDNLGGDAPTLHVVGDPDWSIRQFLQQREPVMDAVVRLANQIGWDLRYRWDTDQFKLTLYQPVRDVPSVDRSFSPSEYGEPKRLAVDIASIRNDWKVIVKDRTSLWPDGTPKRKEYTLTDSDSIDEFGDLYAELQEDETGNIDTETEADKLLAAAVSDCAQPDAELSVSTMAGFPWTELNDFYTFKADGRRFSSDQSLAITSVEQVFDGGRLHTKFETRGKPTIGASRHLAKIVHPENQPKPHPHRQTHFDGPKTARIDFHAIVGGFEVKISADKDKNALISEYEIHVDKDPNFTPDTGTLVALMTGNQMNLAYPVPGQDYYAAAVPRWYNQGQLVRGQPSANQLVTAGRAGAGHLEQYVEWGRMPLNGGFETWNDTATLPDHWNTFQTWGTNFSRATGSGGVSGDSWLRFHVQAVGIANIFTNQFTVEKTSSYDVSWWANITTAGTLGSVSLNVTWFDHNGDLLSSDQVDLIAHDQADMVAGTWYRRGGTVTAPEDARFASIQLKQVLNGNMVLDVDSVRLDRA